MGPAVVALGLAIVAIGALIWAGVPLGRLPGDIAVERENFRFYLPITTSIVVSGAFMLISWLLRR